MNIQLIQLTARIERENELKRPAHPVNVIDDAEKMPVYAVKRANRIEHSFTLPRRRPQCQCV